MSFLELLKSRRSTLKPAKTVVTTCSGEKFIEPHTGERIKINEQSYGFVVDTQPDLMPACILDGFLYLGSQDAVNSENIVNYQLTHVLSVGVEMPSLPFPLTSKFIPCLDLPETNLIENVLPQAINFIEEAREQFGKILVHCNAGVSRSPSIVIAYLMCKQEYTYESAYQLVKTKRKCVRPNDGFIKQLNKLNQCTE